jgi:hypothetical protein
MIRAKIGTPDSGAAKGLSELDDRLGGNQRHLAALKAARAALAQEGAAALPRFEQVSRDYTHYIMTNMGHHGATTELAQKLFSVDDWAYMAGITEEETKREQVLHDRVFASVPKALKLPPKT